MKTLPKRLIKSLLTLLLIVSSVLLLSGCESSLFDKNYKYRNYYVSISNYGNGLIIGREEWNLILYHKDYIGVENIEVKEFFEPTLIYFKTNDLSNEYVKVRDKPFETYYTVGYSVYIKASDIKNIKIDKLNVKLVLVEKDN